jgi:hypothetical protein
LLLSQKMGPQAHFANSSKCGVSRIASHSEPSTAIFPLLAREMPLQTGCRGSAEDDRHRALIHERDRHSGAEHTRFDLGAFRG